MQGDRADILEVCDLKTVFQTRHGEIHAVNSVSFNLKPGELLGVVGESGSGKSVTMLALLGLLPTPPAELRGGTVKFDGRMLLNLTPAEMCQVRGKEIGIIFQDPMTSLNPVLTVGYQITEILRKHLGHSRKKARERAIELLELVGIPDAGSRLSDFPHQFSGGMRQRVMIASALACNPKVLIADEPTTALDVTIQAQIIKLIKDLRQKLGMAIIWITHDLGVIAGIANRVVVMYGGQIVEEAPVDELFANPLHPYTRALLAAVPSIRSRRTRKLASIEGQAPTLTEAPSRCTFCPRCVYSISQCRTGVPPKETVSDERAVACFRFSEVGEAAIA